MKTMKWIRNLSAALLLGTGFTACTPPHPAAPPDAAKTSAGSPAEPAKPQGSRILLDVRTAQEYQSGHLNHALLLPYDRIPGEVAGIIPDKSTPVDVYCRSGRRSAIAREAMLKQGYTDVRDLGAMPQAKEILQTSIVTENNPEK